MFKVGDIVKIIESGELARIEGLANDGNYRLTFLSDGYESLLTYKDSELELADDERVKQIKALINDNQNIAAIKLYRTLFPGTSLKDAKDAVMAMGAKFNVPNWARQDSIPTPRQELTKIRDEIRLAQERSQYAANPREEATILYATCALAINRLNDLLGE